MESLSSMEEKIKELTTVELRIIPTIEQGLTEGRTWTEISAMTGFSVDYTKDLYLYYLRHRVQSLQEALRLSRKLTLDQAEAFDLDLANKDLEMGIRDMWLRWCGESFTEVMKSRKLGEEPK